MQTARPAIRTDTIITAAAVKTPAVMTTTTAKITMAASQHQKTTTEIRIRMTRIKTTINLWYPGQRTHIM